MTTQLWLAAVAGGVLLGPLFGLLLHWLLSNQTYARGVAEGRQLTQIEYGLEQPLSDTSTLLFLRRSPNEKNDPLVTRSFTLARSARTDDPR